MGGFNIGDFGVALGPALNTFGQLYLQGLEDKRRREQEDKKLALQAEDRELAKEQLKLQADETKRRLKQMEFQERVQAREAAYEEIKFMEGRNPTAPQAMPMGPEGQPGVSPDEAAYITPMHPQVQVPSLQEGMAPTAVQPQSLDQVLMMAARAQRAKMQQEITGKVEQERQIRELPPAAEGQVMLPPEMGGGAQPKSTADLMSTVFRERQANARNAADIAARAALEKEKAAAGGEAKPLSAEAARLVGNAKGLADNLVALDKRLREGNYTMGVAGALTGTDRDSSKILSNAKDLLVRIRSGAAAAGLETKNLDNIVLNWKDLFTGDKATTRMGFNRVIDEVNTTLKLMGQPQVQIIKDKVEEVKGGGVTPQGQQSMVLPGLGETIKLPNGVTIRRKK